MYDAHNFEQVLDPDVCIYDAANFVTNGPTDGQADSRSRMYLSFQVHLWTLGLRLCTLTLDFDFGL